ncbi:MAG: chorismate mutase [Litorimonas sp.]
MNKSPKTPILDINQVRREIDRVDKALLQLIAERLALAAAVRKAKSGVRLWRPSREESHVRELAATIADTPTRLVSTIWAELMSSSIALQGSMTLHVSLAGDTLDVWTLVRDRFGAALPVQSYQTTSAALAAAYADEEGVAVLPAPAIMQNWWTVLGPKGAMPDMKIQTGLPRTGARSWPSAVAVATATLQPSGDDDMLIIAPKSADYNGAIIRAETEDNVLLSVTGYHEKSPIEGGAIIGCLPRPIG